MKHPFKFWRVLPLVVLCVVAAFTMTSCGSDDEPKGIVIDYYLNVEEEFLVNGSTALTARYQNPKTRMQEAIRKVYPTPNATGADEAVFAACEAEYQAYRHILKAPTMTRWSGPTRYSTAIPCWSASGTAVWSC